MNSRTVSFTSSIISIQFSFFFSFAQSIAHCVTEHPHRTYVTRTTTIYLRVIFLENFHRDPNGIAGIPDTVYQVANLIP